MPAVGIRLTRALSVQRKLSGSHAISWIRREPRGTGTCPSSSCPSAARASSTERDGRRAGAGGATMQEERGSDPVLTVTELTKVYGGRKPVTAVDHLSFRL